MGFGTLGVEDSQNVDGPYAGEELGERVLGTSFGDWESCHLFKRDVLFVCLLMFLLRDFIAEVDMDWRWRGGWRGSGGR